MKTGAHQWMTATESTQTSRPAFMALWSRSASHGLCPLQDSMNITRHVRICFLCIDNVFCCQYPLLNHSLVWIILFCHIYCLLQTIFVFEWFFTRLTAAVVQLLLMLILSSPFSPLPSSALTVKSLAWFLSEACAAIGLSTDYQQTCVYVYLSSSSQLLGFGKWPPALDCIYKKTTCKSTRQACTDTHYTIHPSIPILPVPLPADTKPPCTWGFGVCLTAECINYLLDSHPRLLGFLVFRGEIFMGLASADGHCAAFVGKWMPTTCTREWISLQDKPWLLSHVISAPTRQLWLCWMSDKFRSGYDEKPLCAQMVRDRLSHCAAACQDTSSLLLDETSYIYFISSKLSPHVVQIIQHLLQTVKDFCHKINEI